MIRYLTTDLDLVARQDLGPLTVELQEHRVSPIHVTAGEDDRWYSTLETDEQYNQPELTIVAMLDAIESLNKDNRHLWRRCLMREFNLGFDCGDKPWAFNEGLTRATLHRMAKVGASLRITLYPPEKKRPRRRK